MLLRAMRLEGRKALVTGGASGIGAAIAAPARRRGRRGRGSATSTPRAPRRSPARSTADAIELDVTDSTRPAPPSRRHGTVRHPRQQRRHRRVRLLHRHDPRAVAAGARDQPRRRAQLHPRGAARHAAGRLRADRQHRLRGGPGRLEGLGRLLGRQGRRDRLHEDDRARERPLRDHRERDRARADRHAAPERAPGASARSASGSSRR